ncbi:hypothetical protein WN944_004973 [Citrus x changshan-huyou]|uniref:Amine oxidase domain-containing protein n=1 Tax=Citrus x changshan-huyou TaxID=2935761 RepID=A0AAP0M5Z6_9ROSI
MSCVHRGGTGLDTVASLIERAQIGSLPSVIVIGGGISGLAAARILYDASFKVVLLESRDRLGGRIHTDYSFGCPVDMGASWQYKDISLESPGFSAVSSFEGIKIKLHGVCNENPLAPLIRRLGLTLYRTSGDNSVLYDHDLESYALYDMDGNKVEKEMAIKVGEIFKRILNETQKVRDENTNDMSVLQAISIVLDRHPELRQEGLAYEVLQWYICRMEAWFAVDADMISLKCWDQEQVLSGGHGLMVQDAAIVTVPLGILKANLIQFEPKLPEWKLSAIADIGVGNENKIALRFDNVFWPNVELLGVVAPTSYACGYFLNLHKATGHPVLVYMAAGRFAYDLEKLSDESAANFVMMQLKKMFPDATEPVQYLVSRWGTDPNTLGCYSYDVVGMPGDLYERLRAPLGNLFFGGEAVSMEHQGSVHGAYSAGVMAAQNCQKYLLKQPGNLEKLQLVTLSHEILGTAFPLQISRM